MSKYFLDFENWMKSYMKHPIGAGADMWDYAFTFLLVVVVLWVIIKLKNNLG